MNQILVLYDSRSGNVAKMAALVAEGAQQVPEPRRWGVALGSYVGGWWMARGGGGAWKISSHSRGNTPRSSPPATAAAPPLAP